MWLSALVPKLINASQSKIEQYIAPKLTAKSSYRKTFLTSTSTSIVRRSNKYKSFSHRTFYVPANTHPIAALAFHHPFNIDKLIFDVNLS
jgi:hypothetical protein